jgi:hypothetical protein
MLRPLERMRVIKRPGDVPTLHARVRSILRKYDATLLLPGPSGVQQYGFQPGNYRESIGQTLAAVDQQVGLALDAARSPGPELVVNGGFDTDLENWSYTSGETGWSWSDGRAVLTNSSAPQTLRQTIMTLGVTYGVGFDVSSVGGTIGFENGIGQIVAGGTSGRISTVWLCDRVQLSFKRAGGTVSGWIDNISVREIPGIQGSQSTSGFQPVLRQAAGVNSWQFDGVDDRLSLSAVPFETTDAYFRVSGVTRNSDSTLRRVWQTQNDSGSELLVWLNSNGCTYSATGAPALTAPMPQSLGVVTVRRSTAGARVLRIDGQEVGANSAAVTPFAATSSLVGNRAAGDRPYSGMFYGEIFGKGAITDSELLTLERFMARLQGRTL